MEKYMIRQCTVVAFLTLAGCVTGPQPQRLQQLASPVAAQVHVEWRLTQHEIYVSHLPSNNIGTSLVNTAIPAGLGGGTFAGGAAIGAVGALIDLAVDAHRRGVAEDNAKPLRANMAGIDVDGLLLQSVAGLDRKLIASTIELEQLGKSEAEDERNGQLQAGSNILVLSPSYSLSYDGVLFTYVLAAKLVDRTSNVNGKLTSVARYRQIFQYVLSQDGTADKIHWEHLSADQWKAILTQASTETVAMLNYDVNVRPSESKSNLRYGALPVTREQSSGERSWVRTSFSLLSVPEASLKERPVIKERTPDQRHSRR
jgi:hypothetical protein